MAGETPVYAEWRAQEHSKEKHGPIQHNCHYQDGRIHSWTIMQPWREIPRPAVASSFISIENDSVSSEFEVFICTDGLGFRNWIRDGTSPQPKQDPYTELNSTVE